MAGIAGTSIQECGSSSYLHFSIFNESSDGIALQDAEGKILWMNEQLCEMIGRPDSPVAGTDAVTFMLSHFAAAAELRPLFPRLLKTTYENGLSLRGIPCRTRAGGVDICYSSQEMGTGLFGGLRLNTFRLRDPVPTAPQDLSSLPRRDLHANPASDRLIDRRYRQKGRPGP
ncbi:PAS domain-containing protein [Methanofollis fontis]|uniref:PAS domain-containing protein n=1 Tax=Methanofollis fontis TaxID=2052832 RepID=A0A483CVR3_9EURY|nr:PAS domain-containing protein [Methanofollis fontis]TAJ45607.1 hypothetical protein CUJ86_02475 [Methanofollis fontis]